MCPAPYRGTAPSTDLVVLEAHALPLSVLMHVAAESVVVTSACPAIITAKKNPTHAHERQQRE